MHHTESHQKTGERDGRASTMSRLHVMKPWLGEEEQHAVAEVMASGWVARARRSRVRGTPSRVGAGGHAVAVSWCTTGLHLALVVLGVGPGDDVIVPSSRSSPRPARRSTSGHPGVRRRRPGDRRPHRSDAPRDHPQTRAVMAVDQGGMPVDLGPLRELLRRRGIVVVEDAACAAGSTYRGRAGRRRLRDRRLVLPPAQDPDDRRGRHGHHVPRRPGGPPRRLREHGMAVAASERHSQVLAPPE